MSLFRSRTRKETAEPEAPPLYRNAVMSRGEAIDITLDLKAVTGHWVRPDQIRQTGFGHNISLPAEQLRHLLVLLDDARRAGQDHAGDAAPADSVHTPADEDAGVGLDLELPELADMVAMSPEEAGALQYRLETECDLVIVPARYGAGFVAIVQYPLLQAFLPEYHGKGGK